MCIGRSKMAPEEQSKDENQPLLMNEDEEEEADEIVEENPANRTLSEEIQQECICCTQGGINRGLLPSKFFYFFFFAGNGALIPYLVLFFKQLGLNPSQVGIVSGLKPFISFIFSPIWGYVADKTRRTRIIYIISLLAYVGGYFSYSLAPSNDLCNRTNSNSSHSTHHPFLFHLHRKKRRSMLFDDGKSNSNYKLYIQKPSTTIQRKKNKINNKDQKSFLKNASMFSYKSQLPYLYTDVTTTLMGDPMFHMPSSVAFFGLNDEFLPTVNFNDNISTDDDVGEDEESEIIKNYNAMSSAKTWHGSVHHAHAPWTACGAAKANSIDSLNLDQTDEDNASAKGSKKVPIQRTFFYLLIVTVTATLFSCPLITFVDTATIRKLRETDDTHKYGNQRMWGSFGWGVVAFTVGAIISALPLCPGINSEVNYIPAFYIFAVFLVLALISGWKLKFEDDSDGEDVTRDNRCFINQPSRSQRIMDGLKLLKSAVYFSFIATSFFIGVTMSIIKTFLFWYLKDIGAPQILFSIIAAVNCISEVTVYLFASELIKKLSHFGVLYVALICYSLRLFYYGLLTNPWFVLAAEPLSGITTAAAWAAMTSYVGVNASPESVTTLQGKMFNSSGE